MVQVDDVRTYYEILEVAETATPEEIHSAYRRLVKEYHPDRVPDRLIRLKKDAEQRTKEINEAWATLGDAAKRTQYDNILTQYRRRSDQESTQRQPPRSGDTSPPPPSPPPPPPPGWPPPPPPNTAPPPSSSGATAPISSPVRWMAWLIVVVLGFGLAAVVVAILSTTPEAPKKVASARPPAPKEPLPFGIRRYESKPFRAPTWGAGPAGGAGLDVQLLHLKIEETGVDLSFRVQGIGHEDFLMYEPPDSKRPRRDVFGLTVNEHFEELHIIVDRKTKLYSTTGLIGGRQSSFNNYNLIRKISFQPTEAVSLVVRFPPIDRFASSITFVSPPLNGWQPEWWWSIQLR